VLDELNVLPDQPKRDDNENAEPHVESTTICDELTTNDSLSALLFRSLMLAGDAIGGTNELPVTFKRAIKTRHRKLFSNFFLLFLQKRKESLLLFFIHLRSAINLNVVSDQIGL